MLRHPRHVLSTAAAVLVLSSLAACNGDDYLPPVSRNDAAIPPGVDGGLGAVDSGSSTGPSGLPCDVAMVFSTYCSSCHGGTPAGGAYNSLTTRDQLLANSTSRPGMTVLDVAVARMMDGSMPPAPATVPAADVATISAWQAAGAPAGSCEMPTDPFAGPDTCTSGTMWTGGNRESELMHPGLACIDCHSSMREGPYLYVAGTVYASGREVPDCNGIRSTGSDPVTVEITDATGYVLNLHPNAAGNFLDEDFPLTFPVTARVLYQDRERRMTAPITNGDCNSCHTLRGANGAPGRIVVP